MNETFWKIFWSIVGAILSAIATWLTTKVTKYIDSRKKEVDAQKYNFLLNEIVANAVITIKQTYVDDLKKQGKFTEDKAIEIKEMAYNMVRDQVSDKMAKHLDETYGDTQGYINNLIEKEVVRLKDEDFYKYGKKK